MVKILTCTGECQEGTLDDCPCDCPNVYLEETGDVYSLSWTNHVGVLMTHTEIAESKEHALSKALCDSSVNIWIFDYLETFNFSTSTAHFLWNRNGKIC